MALERKHNTLGISEISRHHQPAEFVVPDTAPD
jgi:hypothetical protein